MNHPEVTYFPWPDPNKPPIPLKALSSESCSVLGYEPFPLFSCSGSQCLRPDIINEYPLPNGNKPQPVLNSQVRSTSPTYDFKTTSWVFTQL